MKLRKVGEKSIKNAILHRKYMSAHGGPPPYTDEEILVIREKNRVWNEAIDEKNKGSKEDICDLLSPVLGLRELLDKDKAHSVAKRLLGSKVVYAWDFLPIDETCPEWTCECAEELMREG